MNMSTTSGDTATTQAAVTNTQAGGMMQVVAHPPPPFLQNPGEPNISYETWIKMYDNFELLGGFAQLDDTIRRAHFIACLGNEGQRTFFNLDVADESVQAAKNAVKAHYVAASCEEAERYRFKARMQYKEESIDDFVAELRKLVVGCNYSRYGGECEKDMIRDQIVEKVYDSKVREKLLLKANELNRQSKRMTLQDTIDIVRASETVKLQSGMIQGNAAANVGDSGVYKVKSSHGKASYSKTADRQVICFACSKPGHKSSDASCPAKSKRCNICKRTGHFGGSRFCRPGSDMAECKVVDQTANSEDDVYVFTVGNKSEKLMIDANVSCVARPSVSHVFNFQIDTGSNVSILPHDVFRAHFSDTLVAAPRTLTDFSGRVIPVVGCCSVFIEIQGKSCTTLLYVVEKGSALVGLDVVRDTGLDIAQVLVVKDKSDGVSKKVTKYLHQIKLKAGAKPCVQKYRAPPYAVRDKVRSELRRLVDEGVIEPIDSSEWVSPLVIVGKKASGDIRICTDLSRLNQNIVVDCHPLPHMEELVHSMNEAKVFSTLDLKSAYNQIPLTEDSKDLTAFISSEGLFRWCRIPFGLASAPSYFSKLMSKVLDSCRDICVWYLDDICVFGKDQKTHDDNLKRVIQKLDETGLKLNYAKCRLRQPSVEFLGCRVSSEGIAPLEDKISAVMSMTIHTKDELQKFLGMIQYYARFIPNLSAMTVNLRKMVQHQDKNLLWSQEAMNDVNAIKQAFACSGLLVSFDSSLETIVTTDASGIGLGAVLSQIQKDGSERVVSFASKSLSESEAKYCALELEALACVWAVERWHTYLWGRRFLLRTDHNPLTSLYGAVLTRRAGHRVARWRSRLKVYNFEVKYVKGSDNVPADTMSRIPVADNIPVHDNEEEVVALVASAIDLGQFTKACKSDKIVLELHRAVSSNWKHKPDCLDKFYYNFKDEFALQGDLVLRDGRIVVPESMQSQVISNGHEGHQGIAKCKRYIRSMYWWKAMDKHIEQAVRDCSTCKMNDKSCITRDAPLTPVKLPEKVWEKVGLDCVGPFVLAPRDQRYAVTLVDYRSKWPEVAFMSSITSKNIIGFLEKVFSHEGYPEALVSDNAMNFTSSEFEDYLKTCGINHYRSSTYYPRCNGEVERFNRTLKQTIEDAVNEGRDWKKSVTNFLQVYRSSPNSTTGVAPSTLLHGRVMRTKLMLDRSLVPVEDTSGVDDRVDLYQAKQKDYADSRRVAVDVGLQVGDLVRVRQFGSRNKGQSQFSAPVAIEGQVARNTFRLSNGEIVNQSRVAPAKEQPVRQSSRARNKPNYLNDYVT